MSTPLTLDGRPLSQTTRVADLRGTDLVPLVRPSEPLPADQNVSIRADRLQALLGTGSVPAPPGVTLYDTLGIHTDGAATQRLVNDVANAAVRVPNLRPMGHAVTADFVSTPGWGPGSSALADLPIDTLFIGTTAITIYSVAGRFRTYVVADDPQGPLSVWRDGLLSGNRIQASWVLSDAPQAIATAYTSIDGTTYVWKFHQFASAYVGSPLAIQFFQARTAAVHPAPTDGGDPVHWEPISSQVIVPPTAAPLYASQGPYTDGAMTQRATTDALSARFNNRGAWVANTLYQANDAVSINGTTYYRTGAAFTSGAVFDPTNWVSFGAPAVNNLTTSATSNVAPPTIDAVNVGLGLKTNTSDFNILSSTVASRSAPVSVQTFTARIGYPSLDAALAAPPPGGVSLIINAGSVAITVTNPVAPRTRLTGWPAYMDAAGANVVVSDGITVNLPDPTIEDLVICNAFFFAPTQGQTSTATLLLAAPLLTTAPNLGANRVAQFINNTSYVPVQMQGGGLTLNNGFYVSVTGTGTLYLFGNVTVGTIAAGITVVDKRPAADTFAVLPYAANIAVDFNTATVRTIAATGNLAYGPSLNVALLRTKEHYLTNTTGAAITLSFPAGWTFFPGPVPTSLAAGKQAVLTLRSLGTDDSTVKAAYVAQA